jgi:hypothetical protein
MSKEVKRQKASSFVVVWCSTNAVSCDVLCQVGFASSEVVMKEEADAPMAAPDVAMMPTGSNLAPQQYRALLLKRFSENKDNVLGFLSTYKDRLEGELQFLSTSVHPQQRAICACVPPHACCSVPPASYLDFGRPTTRRKSGSGAGREEEEEEAVVAARAQAPSTPHSSHSDRHQKGSDRHRHRPPRSHDKRVPGTPLDQEEATPTALIPSSRDRSGSSRPRSSKPKGAGTDAPAESSVSSNRPQRSSLISLREETDALPLTREVQELMARQKVSPGAVPACVAVT